MCPGRRRALLTIRADLTKATPAPAPVRSTGHHYFYPAQNEPRYEFRMKVNHPIFFQLHSLANQISTVTAKSSISSWA